MLESARAREFEAIICETLSRLWRNGSEQSQRLAELRDLGISVIGRDVDMRAEGSHLMGAIHGAMNEHYRQELRA